MTDREGPEVIGLCLGCRHYQSTPYRVQGDSGYDRRCLAAQRDFPDSYGDQRTPDWCPHPGALTAAEQRDELAAALRGVLRESDRKTDSEWPLAKRVQALVQRCRTFEDVLTMMPEFGNMTNYGPACVACGEHQRETWGYVARGPDRGHKFGCKLRAALDLLEGRG